MNEAPAPEWWAEIEHFKPNEFDSPDVRGSGVVYMQEGFIRKLDTLRSLYRKPMVISSGYRTPGYNKQIGGATKSKHLEGIAADIAVSGTDAYELVGLAFALGFKGIGIKQKGAGRFIHLDDRDENPVIWSY